jgi:glycosyltransferase involved in cell wall biosynthesis
VRQTLRIGRLRLLDSTSPEPSEWPRVSVVIAACNEERTIEGALATLLSEDYPDLEIVLVDDRSTDATGAIIDRLAERDGRVRPVHVRTLPDGWLGKVHALDQGAKRASGRWVLFTDADVHFHRGALRKAIARCEAERLDHLSVLPDARSHSFAEEVVLVAVGESFLRTLRAPLVGRPGTGAYAGVGAFNLVRRSALDRTEGFAWLRMEVLDDVGLGLMLLRSGARAGFALGPGEITMDWYASLPAMAKGLEKNLFGFYARFRYGRLAAFVLGVWLILAGPSVSIAQRALPFEWAAGTLAYACLAVYALRVSRKVRRPFLPVLLLPIGQLAIPLLVLRSAISCWRNRGIVWRGTTYSLAALRAGQRVAL